MRFYYQEDYTSSITLLFWLFYYKLEYSLFLIGHCRRLFNFSTKKLNWLIYGLIIPGTFFFSLTSAQAQCTASITPAGSAIICPGNTLVLTASNGVEYTWYRDGGEIAGAKNRTYTAVQAGTYKVKINQSSPDCEATSDEFTLRLVNTPDFSFSPTATECSTKPTKFTIASPQEGITYTWDFGDGSGSETGNQVEHLFNAFGAGNQSFNVKVNARAPNGCAVTSSAKTITVIRRPNFQISETNNFKTCIDNISGGVKADVEITNLTSTASLNEIVSYSIDWGDGSGVTNISKAQFTGTETLTHTYNKLGLYPVVLIAISNTGCNSEVRRNYVLEANPVANLVGPPAGTNVGCGPLTVSFVNNSTNVTPTTRFRIDFGDGSPIQDLPAGVTGNTITHTYSATCLSNGVLNTRKATLFAMNECRQSESSWSPIQVRQAAQANFNVPAKGCVNQPVTFANTSTPAYCANNPNTRYTWDWNDGSPPEVFSNIPANLTQQQSVPHIFTKPGTYTITLTAENLSNNGCGGTTQTKTITIIDKPLAAFTTTLNPVSGCTNATVTLANQSTGEDLTYDWKVLPNTGYTLAPGSTLTAKEPIFIFNTAGDYKITLTAKNICGTSTKEETVKIIGSPQVSLPGNKTYCGPQVIKFETANTNHAPAFTANGTTIAAYTWVLDNGAAFVNGSTADTPFPEISFPAPGTYSVTIKATNDCGTSVTATQQIIISASPDAPVLTDAAICSGTGITLTATGSNGTYNWYATATGGTPLKTGPTLTTGVLTADATYFAESVNSSNCVSARVPVKVTVYPNISNNSISAEQTVCAGTAPALISGTAPSGGSGTFTFAWEISSNGTTFVPAPGKNDEATYQPEAINQSVWLRRIVASDKCENRSNLIKITVEQPLAGNTISDDQIICSGLNTAVLKGNALTGGTGNYSYRWQSSPDNNTFTDISGATAATYNPGSLTQTTYYQRIVKSGVCAESTSNTIKITVNPAHANNTIGVAQTICKGLVPAALKGELPTGGDGTFVYEWESSEVSALVGFAAAAGDNRNIDYAPGSLTQTTWFRRKVTSGGCSTYSEAIEINVIQLIGTNTITTGGGTLCEGSPAPQLLGSAPVGGNNAYTFLWQVSTTSGTRGFVNAPGSNTGKDYQPAPLTQPTWFRRVVMSGPCVADTSAAIKFEINVPVSQNTISSSNPEVCAGDIPNTLTGSLPTGGSGTYTYTWETSTTGPTTGFNTAAGISDLQNYAPGPLTRTTWFRRRVTSLPCNPNFSEAVKIEVLPGITENNIPARLEICENTAPSLIIGTQPGGGNGTFRYLWQTSSDELTFTEAPGNNTGKDYTPPTLTETTWYRRVVYSGPACANNSVAIRIEVNKNISNNTITRDQLVCGSSVPDALSGSTPAGGNGQYTYLWEMSTDNSSFSPAPGTNNQINYAPGSLPRTTWFRRKVTAGPCNPSFSQVVKIAINPELVNNTISRAQRICKGTLAAPLTGTTPTGGDGTYTFIWEVSLSGANSGYSPAPGQANEANYQLGYVGQTAWYRRTVISGGCTLVSRPIQITVDTEITDNTVSAAQVLCKGSSPAKLIGSTPQGGSTVYEYLWEMSTDSINFSPAAGINNTRDYEPRNTTTTWFRRVVTSRPCAEHESNTVKIKVVEVLAQNSISAPQLICYNSVPASLVGSEPVGGSGNYVYLWESSTTSATAGFGPAAGTNNTVNYTAQALKQTTWFRRTVISAPCASLVSNIVRVEVKPQPPLPVVVGAATCPGTTATLTATATADRLEWFNAPVAGNLLHTGGTFITPPLTETTTYYVQSIVDGCAGDRQEVKVQVFPVAANAGLDVTIMQGQPTVLQATGGASYRWSPATGLSDTTIAMPTAKPSQTTTYHVTVTTAEGCILTDEVTVTVLPLISVSNGLTPNGDSFNDTWQIKNIEFYPQAEVEIFNRWGNKIFSSKGYTKPWDGTYNGKELPIAAYYYIIRLNHGDQPIAGSITLVR